MKRIFKVLSVACVAIMALSCYDDTKVWEKLNSLETQLSKLNEQVTAISTIVSAVEKGDYITSVTELKDGGYTIAFAKGKSITIHDGEKGADGKTPVIGATKDVDGIYYWTIDGEWLLDAAGKKVPAGMGQPKLKTENGQWFISVDGKEWALIGPDVACTIKNVAVADDAVTFTLANGQNIVIPIVKALDITFNVEDGHIYEGKSFDIEYTITGGTDKNRVVLISNVAKGVVTPTDANTGKITISLAERVDFEVAVFVTDGVSRTIFKTLKFIQGVFTSETTALTVGMEGETINIPVVTSMEFDVTADCDWITKAPATKGEVREETVSIVVAKNEGMNARTANVSLVPTDESYAGFTIVIPVKQQGRANQVWSKVVSSIEGYDAAKKVRLAKYGDKLLLANTTKVFMINPLTGEVEATIPMPEGVVAHSVLVDDAGNFMIAADAGVGADMTLYYVADPMNPAPEVVLTYNTGNYYGTDTGNIRVRGNIKANATITATVSAGAGGAMLYWSVVNGVCGNWAWTSVPYAGGEVAYACAAPAGTDVAAGFFYIGYQGDYNLKYAAAANAGSTEWVTSFVTGSSWMENYNCITTAEWKNNKYAAILKGCHFNYDDAEMLLLNVNNPAAAELVYEYSGTYDVTRSDAWANLDWTGKGAYSDILLVPTENALLMVGVDSNFGTVTCVSIQ